MLTMDFNNDGVLDLFFSEESCVNLYLLSNQGTATTASMSSFSTFPSASPLTMPFFPAPYAEDVDFDGLQDLIVSPNIGVRNSSSEDFQKSIYLFKNSGTQQIPQFSFVKPNFLQEDMIDLGDFSVPAFFDSDGDGDQDMFVANYIKPSLSGVIYQFENIGTSQSPAFKLINEDSFFLSSINQYNFKIQFADMNGDSKIDLVLSATRKSNFITEIFYLANSSIDKLVITDPVLKETNFTIGQSENWLVVDVNQDGLNDILVGNDTGAIEYWRNIGSETTNNYSLVNASFLGIGNSTDRQNLALSSADLDADGRVDLIVGDQLGKISIYGNYLSQNPNLTATTNIVYNELNQTYESKNLGGRIWLTPVNLFNSNKPALVVGNTLGGLIILKNDAGKELPLLPNISIFPNPYNTTNFKPLTIFTDRNVFVQFYNLLGQKFSDIYFITANQEFPINTSQLPAGMYIAQFSYNGKIIGKRIVVY